MFPLIMIVLNFSLNLQNKVLSHIRKIFFKHIIKFISFYMVCLFPLTLLLIIVTFCLFLGGGASKHLLFSLF